MASNRGFSTSGRSGGGKGGSAPRSQGSGGKLQQRMANSGTKGGAGIDRSGPAIIAARTNVKARGANVRLGGSPRPGRLP